MISTTEIKNCLAKEKSTVFKLNYTPEQKKCFKEFDIQKKQTFSYYGKVNDIDSTDFLAGIGNNSASSVKILNSAIKQLASEVCKGYGKNHAWIDIRITRPSKYFDIPRWHQDGPFFIANQEEREQLQTKFITSLKGPGTLMLNATKAEKQAYLELSHNAKNINHNSIEYRKKVAEIFKDRKVHQLSNNQGLIFLVGRDTALIHSEPPMTETRIFVSVLPGTESQIKALETRWNRK